MISLGLLPSRLGRSCKLRSCSYWAQLQMRCPPYLKTATATATASHVKPTTASATANDGFQPGTTASTTTIAAASHPQLQAQLEILGLAQLQMIVSDCHNGNCDYHCRNLHHNCVQLQLHAFQTTDPSLDYRASYNHNKWLRDWLNTGWTRKTKGPAKGMT